MSDVLLFVLIALVAVSWLIGAQIATRSARKREREREKEFLESREVLQVRLESHARESSELRARLRSTQAELQRMRGPAFPDPLTPRTVRPPFISPPTRTSKTEVPTRRAADRTEEQPWLRGVAGEDMAALLALSSAQGDIPVPAPEAFRSGGGGDFGGGGGGSSWESSCSSSDSYSSSSSDSSSSCSSDSSSSSSSFD